MVASQTRPLVVFLDLAPGVGGGERAVIPALARTERLQVLALGTPPVAEFAARMGLESRPMRLPGVRLPIVGALRLIAGGRKVRSAFLAAGGDVLYTNNSRAIAYGMAAGRNIRLVAHNHEMLPRGGLVKAMERRASAIIVPSSAAAAPFRRSGKVTVLPTGVDLERFAPGDSDSAKAKFGLRGGPVVGFIGRADPRKGMEAFVRVSKRIAPNFPEAQFLLVGGALFPHEVDYFEGIKEDLIASVPGRAFVTGPLMDVAPALKAMDLIVHLPEAESLGNSLIEAAATRVPAVAFDGGGAPEIVTPQTGILITQGDEDAAAEAVGELLNDPAKRVQMGTEARKRAEILFGLDRFVSGLEEVVLNLCGQTHSM